MKSSIRIFHTSRRQLVVCGSANRRAGQRDAGAQQSFPQWAFTSMQALRLPLPLI